jgi:hypothetical protein
MSGWEVWDPAEPPKGSSWPSVSSPPSLHFYLYDMQRAMRIYWVLRNNSSAHSVTVTLSCDALVLFTASLSPSYLFTEITLQDIILTHSVKMSWILSNFFFTSDNFKFQLFKFCKSCTHIWIRVKGKMKKTKTCLPNHGDSLGASPASFWIGVLG